MKRNQYPPGTECMTVGHGERVMAKREAEQHAGRLLGLSERLDRIEAALAAVLSRLEKTGGNADGDS